MAEKPTYEELENRVSELMVERSRFAKVEAELNRSLRFTESLLSAIPTPIFFKDAQGRYQGCNPTFTEIMGVAAQDLRGKTVHELWPSEHAEVYHQKDLELMLHPKRQIYDFQVKDKNGTIRPVIFYKNVFHDEHGNVAGLVGGFVDITEHKRVEDSLKKSERKYRQLFERSTDAIFVVDKSTGRYLDANAAAEELTGFPVSDLKNLTTQEVTPYGAEKRLKTIESSGGKTNFEEVLYIRKDGSKRIARLSVVPLDDETVYGIAHDITERKQAEEALHESEERFRTLVEKSPLGISLIADDGVYKYINPQFTNILGYTIEDIPTGNAWFKKSFPDKEYRQKVIRKWIEDKKQINVGQARPRVFTVTCKDGAQKKIHFRPVTMENRDQFVIYEDVTEKSSLEHQLLQAQKYEAIGTLAGGIAHDFNNLLMGIQGRASLMSVDLGPSHSHIEHIKSIEECIRSATGLTKQLLGFARGGKYEVKPININELVRNSATMFSRTRKEINIHTKMPQSPLIVEADRGQIEQVLLNLYVNAWQAMPDGGELYLETSAVVLDDNYCIPYETKPGRYAKVSVTDTGIGMNEDTRRRIFDPFFTTKEKGRGTGLGLASAYGIIKNHGGIITVFSERNHGTTFNIYLQISEKEIDQEIATDGGMVKGSGTILLVDDEDMIINVGQALLERLGYQVITVKSGEEAAEVVLRIGSGIDLVILDMIMPGMDGGKTFDRIREIHPQMPVLLSSGYAVNGQATEILRKGCNGFIQKPFNIANLSQKIRNIVEAAKDGSKR